MKRIYRNVVFDDGGETFSGEYSFDGGDFWIKFSASWRLFVIDEAQTRSDEAANLIWSEQDGYGCPGYTPVQGYDWSGIRDSSEEAKEAMYEIAKRYLDEDELRASLLA